MTAIGLLAFGLGRFAWVSVRRAQAIATAHRLNRGMPDTGSDLVVLADPAADAYAVPGRPGRIFVTQGMLALLSREECDAMLAHERSHLRHHHHWHRTAVLLASALNPLLATLPQTQSWVTERWADEDAADGAERAVVASALSRAADAVQPHRRPAAGLALTTRAVDSRVAALRAEPPRLRPLFLGVTVMILILSVLGTLDGITDEAHLFHVAIAGQAFLEHYGHLRHVLARSVTRPLRGAAAGRRG
jgi:hypothetical protein